MDPVRDIKQVIPGSEQYVTGNRRRSCVQRNQRLPNSRPAPIGGEVNRDRLVDPVLALVALIAPLLTTSESVPELSKIATADPSTAAVAAILPLLVIEERLAPASITTARTEVVYRRSRRSP